MTVFKQLLNDYRDCLLQGDHVDASAAYLALVKENESLQSRLESLEQELKDRNEACIGLNSVIKRMAEDNIKRCGQMESLENDAAKYRLASEQDNFCDFVIHAFGCYCDDKESADRVIDTAMQANKGE